ncbi:MAG: 16S rRNA (cytidine(1402)-2'-O)-methyltransferase [Bdellovibrionaceae bacterium]|nr:16S rRNA (cytidine(1402)-2'-O)-methyltransferase [Pseudobdellovibrionaceae bacterium]
MALKVVATPIGNLGDITLRAIEALKAAEIVIGEERRVVSTLLKRLGIENRDLRLLNEHSSDADVVELLQLCREKDVALVSDAGTPGFCDPGARLVAACRRENVPVTALPGASSLMCLLTLSGNRLDQFLFRGFLPAEREARDAALRELARESRPVIVMDTPYRLTKLLTELAERFPTRRALLGMDLTQESECIWEGLLPTIAARAAGQKAEFVLLIFPGGKMNESGSGGKMNESDPEGK